MKNDVIIVGGGASGLMAALSAEENGANVTIIERNDRIGRKILATGNGRCNWTNIYMTIEDYHGENEKFPYSVLSQLDVYGTMDYFERIGITPYIGDEGKVFPASLQSASVIDIFMYEIKNRNIKLELETKVLDIKKTDKFIVETDKKTYKADKVIVATGGMALPTSGSDGNGYELLKKKGHKVVDIFPGIVQLNLAGKFFKEISGVRIDGIAELYIDDVLSRSEEGDVLWTNYGISGPTILQLSRMALKSLREGKKVEIGVKVVKDKDQNQLYEYLVSRFELMGERTLEESLVGLINKKLIRSIIKEVRLDKNKFVAEISNEEINELAKILSTWKFKVTGSQPWEFAQVTAGGIDTKEVNNRTLESNIIEGLYITGEILDVDGDCGGYNLQWAWSSGYVAGSEAAKS